MVNGALIWHLLKMITIQSHTYSYTGGRGDHTMHQLAHLVQLGVQCLAQGHFDTDFGGTSGSHAATLYPRATAADLQAHNSQLVD